MQLGVLNREQGLLPRFWRQYRGLTIAVLCAAALLLLGVVSLLLVALGAWPVNLSSDDMHQFLLNTFNGLTVGALYFLVASGFTLIFGLMRVVNLAHGSLYLFGGYLGFSVADASGTWLLGVLVAFGAMGFVGILVQQTLLRPLQGDAHSFREAVVTIGVAVLVVFLSLAHWGDMSVWLAALVAMITGVLLAGFILREASTRSTQGRDLREALVTIGLSIVAADLLLAHYTGLSYQLTAPDAINGATNLHLVTDTINHASKLQMPDLIYPSFKLFALVLAVAVGIALWFMMSWTRLGIIVRAAIDDREMVAALGINIQIIFALLFGLGAALAGLAGVMQGSNTSLTTGDDGPYLLASLIVVIIGGLGSLGGAFIGAMLVGLVEQYGQAYSPTNAETLIFLMMVVVLAIRPQGLLGRPG